MHYPSIGQVQLKPTPTPTHVPRAAHGNLFPSLNGSCTLHLVLIDVSQILSVHLSVDIVVDGVRGDLVGLLFLKQIPLFLVVLVESFGGLVGCSVSEGLVSDVGLTGSFRDLPVCALPTGYGGYSAAASAK